MKSGIEDGAPNRDKVEKDRLAWAISRLPEDFPCGMLYTHFVGGVPIESVARIYQLDPVQVAQEVESAGAHLRTLLELNPLPGPNRIAAVGFRYLLSPDSLVAGRADDQPCVACGQHGSSFHLLETDESGRLWDHRYVCDACTCSGRTEALGLSFNEADEEQLAATLAVERPDLSAEAQHQLARDRSREVVFCTPRPPILQPFSWPAHCGDYLGFVSQVLTNDLSDLAADGDGLRFFRRHLSTFESPDEEWLQETWTHGFAPEGFTNVYLWRCLHCGDPVLTSDHD